MNKMKNNPVEKIMVFFQSNKMLNKVLEFTIKIGFEDCIFRIIYGKYLSDRRKFFEDHANDISENIELLYDEKSKKVYEGLIKYRKFRKRKYFPEYCEDDQYFPEDVIELNSDEVFVDCGAYQGDTVVRFLERVGNKYKKIVCFEPEKDNYDKLVVAIKNKDNIFAINKGVFDVSKIISFESGKGGSSTITKSGEEQIFVDKIDNIEVCEGVTFLKMDIEGSEPEAINGAKEMIMKYKPTLAICIYHSDEDMISIIKQVHNLVPEYRMYVRQHSIFETETVLYCVY